jgi:hypothetical protein
LNWRRYFEPSTAWPLIGRTFYTINPVKKQYIKISSYREHKVILNLILFLYNVTNIVKWFVLCLFTPSENVVMLLLLSTIITNPHRWCLLLIVVVGSERSWYPESYAGGSVATGRGIHAGQVKR